MADVYVPVRGMAPLSNFQPEAYSHPLSALSLSDRLAEKSKAISCHKPLAATKIPIA